MEMVEYMGPKPVKEFVGLIFKKDQAIPVFDPEKLNRIYPHTIGETPVFRIVQKTEDDKQKEKAHTVDLVSIRDEMDNLKEDIEALKDDIRESLNEIKQVMKGGKK